MRLEPRHFGALSGLGMIHMRAGNHAAALTAYQAAQQINPHLVKISELIDQLVSKIARTGHIKTIVSLAGVIVQYHARSKD